MAEVNISFKDISEGAKVCKMIRFTGQLDETNVDNEAKKIYQVITEITPPYVILDFSELSYMNSKSIGYVTDWFTQIAAKGGKMVIYNPRPNILDILKVVGITQIIEIHSDLEMAKTALNTPNVSI